MTIFLQYLINLAWVTRRQLGCTPTIDYCKTHYYRVPFNFTHFALGDDNAYITGADLRSK